jgi:tetratricopeptide (TPR) repeat protein
MKTLAIAALLALAAGSASAAVDVIGNGLGHDCFVFARDGRAGDAQIDACTSAITSDTLNMRDRAATYVNRGVLRLRREQYPDALKDFDAAIAVNGTLAEAHVDRGAALVMLGRQQEAIAALDLGLELKPDSPQNGYFIRAMARERAGDLNGAYADYTRAAELAPNWARPQNELRRFTVRKPG